jgi:hypothetical protein
MTMATLLAQEWDRHSDDPAKVSRLSQVHQSLSAALDKLICT